MVMNSPSVLSLLKRCRYQGFKFLWEPWGEPKFYTPEGLEGDPEVATDVPYLPRNFVTGWKKASHRKLPEVMPAVVDGEDHSSATAAENAGKVHASVADAAAGSGAAPAEAPQSASAPAAASDEAETVCKIPAERYLTHLPKHPECDPRRREIPTISTDGPRRGAGFLVRCRNHTRPRRYLAH